MELILLISYLILFFLILILIINIINFLSIKKIKNKFNSSSKRLTQDSQKFSKKISVLIPVRNEENNILKCLNSVLREKHIEYEIIVLNDNSTDNTANILKSINNQKVKIIQGEPLPEGWVGKNFACHQLSESATGDYLLFIDADTEIKEGGLLSAGLFMENENPDLLSLMPEEETKTFWEKIVIPMLHFTVMNFLPIALVEYAKSEKLLMSNGQFMMFKRESYFKSGGHKKLKNKIVEDVWFGRLIKQTGGKVIFADGVDIIKCRMYSDFIGVWNGFSKNLFPGLSFSLIGLINIFILYGVLFVLPLLILIYSFFTANIDLLKLSVLNFSIPIIIRILQAIKFKLPVIYSFTNFIGSFMIILFGINSLRILRFGRGSQWKGRFYKESEIK